jgi:hypothetical protein
MSDQDDTIQNEHKEEAILLAVKKALTLVVKDTATAPGLKHPLTDDTIRYIRDCLGLISQREQELAETTGRDLTKRPKFTDELQPQDEVVVQFTGGKPGSDDKNQ